MRVRARNGSVTGTARVGNPVEARTLSNPEKGPRAQSSGRRRFPLDGRRALSRKGLDGSVRERFLSRLLLFLERTHFTQSLGGRSASLRSAAVL